MEGITPHTIGSSYLAILEIGDAGLKRHSNNWSDESKLKWEGAGDGGHVAYMCLNSEVDLTTYIIKT